jgi:hypothetical protein
MNRKKRVGSSIDLLRLMLADNNNELSSEQRSKLKKAIGDLKRLRRAVKVSDREVFEVVDRVAEAVFEAVISGKSM